MKFNCYFSAIHLDGKLNRGPDCLSRFRLQAFKQAALRLCRRRTYRSRLKFIQEPSHASLDRHWTYLMSSGLARSTQLSYSGGQRAFLSFCMQFGIYNEDLGLLPAAEIAILRFIAYAAQFYKPSTIKPYLSAVRSLHV